MTDTAARPARPAAPPHRRLYRSGEDRLLGGVASGVAGHLGVRPIAVRAAFALLTGAGGAGLLLYAALWGFVPLRRHDPAAPTPQREGNRAQSVALVALAAGALLLGPVIGVSPGSALVWPALVAGGGVALIWRQADDRQRARWSAAAGRLSGRSARGGWVRVLAGAVLLATGLVGFLATTDDLARARTGLLAGLVAAGGAALLSAPWWARQAADLREERRARIRSQERAELAAHLHDSVLHTLALIQRHSGDAREVARLARAQERELRGWLYRPGTAGPGVRFAAAVEQAAAEVEDRYAVPVEVVVVGDCPLDEQTRAVVAATREALVNAARHSGAPGVSLYAEAEGTAVSVFVRDRGRGFDPAGVPADRLGLAESVHGRMARHGGTATVRSAPGEGTEVALEVSRP